MRNREDDDGEMEKRDQGSSEYRKESYLNISVVGIACMGGQPLMIVQQKQ